MNAFTRIHAIEARKFRRTGVAVLWKKNPDGHPENLLIVRSGRAALANHPAEVWLLPQGGIRDEELLIEGMLRELNEELGIPEHDLGNFSEQLAVSRLTGRPRTCEPSSNPRDKEYTLISAVYLGQGLFRLNPKEIAETRWVSRSEASKLIAGTNQPGKTDFLLSGIEAAYRAVCA